MNKKELKRRGKGLLALMLAFMMMFGSSMTVFAGTVYNLRDSSTVLNDGDTLQGGDILIIRGSGSLTVTIDSSSRQGYNAGNSYCVELPAGDKYRVDSYSKVLDAFGDPICNVALSTISATPSGSTGNTSTESNSDDTKSENISPELSEEEQYIARLRSEYWENHVHTFSWVTTREATAEQDGIQENRCSCGLVQDTAVISAGQVILQKFYDMVRNAPADGTVSYDSGSLHTLSDKMLECLSERSDVTVEISFVYEGTAYKMTIPAGCDYSALLSDEDAFYGYFYFAQQTGAKIEPVA